MNPFMIKDTYDLIRVAEQIQPAASYLLDTFFPNKEVIAADYFPLETYKEGRRLAPFLVDGAKGLNMSRESSTVRAYKCPCIGARRIISLNDIMLRSFGETPVLSTKTPADRAAEMQARDLAELLRVVQNRRNAMAAELLTTGQITVKAYADDGKIPREEVISYGAAQGKKNWTESTADIYGDLMTISEQIQREAGAIPTLMIVGANVEKYLLNNAEMSKWLLSANANATAFMSYQPRYSSPQVRTLGYIGALNLEVVSYLETYREGEQVKAFVPADTVIIGVPGRGRQVYGAVSYLDESKEWQTALAENVPIYNADTTSQQTSLTVLSRFLPVPEDMDSWQCLNVATPSNAMTKKAKGLPAL